MSRRKKPRYKRGDIVEHWDFFEGSPTEKHYYVVVSVAESYYMSKSKKRKILLYKMWDAGSNVPVEVEVPIADMVGWGRWERHCYEVFFPFRATGLDSSKQTE